MGWLERTVETRLQGDGVGRVEVQPVVVIWAPFEQRSLLSGRVAWVGGKQIAKVLLQRPVRLTSDEVMQIDTALRRPLAAPRRRELSHHDHRARAVIAAG
jgi:hypothetical protein